jgi:hypothetical protein
MRSLGIATLLLLALAAPASAGTANCVAPPGTAAIDEYCETVPSATGNGGGGARSARGLDHSSTRALRAQGADGAALATLLTSDGNAAPKRSPRQSHGAVAGTSTSATATNGEPSQNPLHAVTSAVQSGPTLGGGFAWALLAITALMLGAGWIRLRGRRSAP